MGSRVLADLLVLVHFGFVLFVVAGGALVLRWPRLAWVHVPAAIWGAWIELSGGICPLTPWEKSLRERAGQVGLLEGTSPQWVAHERLVQLARDRP